MIREVGYVIAPDVAFRVELRSGSEGSLGLNTVIRALGSIDAKTLRRIAAAVGAWFALEAGSWTVGQLMDAVAGSDETHLTEEDYARITEMIEKGTGRTEAQRVYRELERDPAIRGVGVTSEPGQRPSIIVPRSEFRVRAGYGTPRVETVQRRVTDDRFEAILIKPVLVPHSTRRRRFSTAHGEISLVMKDDQFVDDLLSGARPAPMLLGLVVDMAVETMEELVDGVWTVTGRSVQKVYGIRAIDRSLTLPFGHDHESDDDED